MDIILPLACLLSPLLLKSFTRFQDVKKTGGAADSKRERRQLRPTICNNRHGRRETKTR